VGAREKGDEGMGEEGKKGEEEANEFEIVVCGRA